MLLLKLLSNLSMLRPSSIELSKGFLRLRRHEVLRSASMHEHFVDVFFNTLRVPLLATLTTIVDGLSGGLRAYDFRSSLGCLT